ncbi:MAG: hypothetical protein HOV80_12510, partial [Polyangiaceae bacterium]|nr:hypothetical protein [Polyangiaceae bacterium]
TGPLDRKIAFRDQTLPAWWILRRLDAGREERAPVVAALDAAFPANDLWALCLDIFSGAYGDNHEQVLGPARAGALVDSLAARPSSRADVQSYLATLARATETKSAPRPSILSVSTCLGALARWEVAPPALPPALVAFGMMGDSDIARAILRQLPVSERETVMMTVPSGQFWSIPAFDLIDTDSFAKSVVDRAGAGVPPPVRPLALAAIAALGDKGQAALAAHLGSGGADKNGVLSEARRSS